MSKKLTRVEWQDVRAGLALVPPRARNDAWEKLVGLVDRVLAAPADIQKEFDPETLRFSVPCGICQQPVRVDQNHIVRVTGDEKKGINHLDCWYKDVSEV